MFAFTRKACVAVVCLGFASIRPVVAQPVWEWAVRGFSSGSFDALYGRGIAADSHGNVYVAGKFSGTATFGDTNTPVTSYGDSDAFLAKYNDAGELQWCRKFGGTGSDEANAVAVDTNGFVYVAGRYSGPGTFGSYTLTNTGYATGFTFKFDPATTNVLWAKDDGLEWWGLAVDGNGNSYVVGQPLGLQIAGSKLAGPVALAKYNSSGVRQWYTNSLSPSLFAIGSGKAIAVDTNGNVYITGIFHQVVEFGSTSLTNAAVANNTRDEIFVAKYSSAGVPQWARRGGGEGDDQGLGIGVDGAGNVIVTGLCDLTTSLNSGTSVQFDIGGFVFPGAVGGGLGNLFLAKFTSSGAGVWAKKLGGTSLGTAVSASAAGEFYVAGDFKTNPLDFGGVSLTKSHTLEELFAVKYDSSGNAIWGRCSSSLNVGTRFGRAIVPATDGSVYETGEYQGTFPTEFDATILGSKSTGASMFVAKLANSAPGRPNVQSIRLLAGGVVQLMIANSEGQQFVVEASGSVSGFSPITTNAVSGGVLEFTDSAAASASVRFYRLRLP